MKIAIGTTDGRSVCDHLARSSTFLIFEVENGRIVACSVRERSRGACGDHASFVDLLKGCRAVVCGGIGQGAVDSLLGRGIEPVVVVGEHSVHEAMARYLAGSLVTTNERVCLCR